MPTLDQLAPAIAVSDTDEMLVSQNGICVKATRAQVVAGLQAELSFPSGSLAGRSSAAMGGPESIAVGANLTLAGGILSASAAPYVVAALPQGTVPAINDMVPLGQSGANTAVPYSQFMSGISNIPSINASNMVVTPSGSATSTTVASLAANTLPLSGGKMNGPLLLSGDPVQPLQASTKEYVDAQSASYLPKSGGRYLAP